MCCGEAALWFGRRMTFAAKPLRSHLIHPLTRMVLTPSKRGWYSPFKITRPANPPVNAGIRNIASASSRKIASQTVEFALHNL